MSVPGIKLADNHQIPQVGLGLWQVKDEEEFNRAFEAAVQAGYRHFDTAQMYGNEQFLGAAWQRSHLKREDIFITTKIAVSNFGRQKPLKSFAASLEKLQTDYADLLLLHFPVTLLRKKSWQALEEIKSTGGAKSIGVSNYTIRHLEEMQGYAKILPAVNQVELHVFLQQPELLEYCSAEGIIVEAYSPLAHAKEMNEPVVKEIAEKYGKSYAQIMLRWCVQKGLVVIPKSVNPGRIKENIGIFNFQLDEPDMQKLVKLDRNLRTCWSPVHVP